MTLSQHVNLHRAESARYALFRRLAPILRHDLAGALQPLSMMSLVLEKRLQSSNLDHAALVKSSDQLKTQVRQSSNACMELIGWLTPNDSDMVSVAAGIEEAIGLMMSALSFKGFNILNKVTDVQAKLPRAVTRSVYLAALLAITDSAVAPADVALELQLEGSDLTLIISTQSGLGEVLSNDPAPYRKIEWGDVEALAEFYAVRLSHAANSVKMHMNVAIEATTSTHEGDLIEVT